MRNPWCEMFQAYAPASPNAPERAGFPAPETGHSLRQNALDPGFHGVPKHPGTHWIRGFMALHRAPSARLALAPDDPADVLIGGDDPPARRGVQPARRAGCPAGHPVSTTVVPAGGGCRPGLNCFSSVQETSNACGTISIQPSEGATATWSPGRTLSASISVIASWVFDPSACEMWLVIWATATRLTAATQTPNAADTPARGPRTRRHRRRGASPGAGRNGYNGYATARVHRGRPGRVPHAQRDQQACQAAASLMSNERPGLAPRPPCSAHAGKRR